MVGDSPLPDTLLLAVPLLANMLRTEPVLDIQSEAAWVLEIIAKSNVEELIKQVSLIFELYTIY